MSTNVKLDGAFAKAQRASEHLEQLKQQREQCITRKFVRSSVEQEGVFYVARIRIPSPLPPRVSSIVGDLVHNLRSALDHLACAMIEASGGTVTKTTHFPILEEAARFREVTARQLPSLSSDFLGLLETFQPFRQTSPVSSPLQIIHRLDIEDKHRGLLLAAIAPDHAKLNARGRVDQIYDIRFNESLPFPLHDGDELVRFRLRRDVQLADIDLEIQLGADLALIDVPPVHGQPIVFLCHDLIEYMYKDVLLHAAPLLAR